MGEKMDLHQEGPEGPRARRARTQKEIFIFLARMLRRHTLMVKNGEKMVNFHQNL